MSLWLRVSLFFLLVLGLVLLQFPRPASAQSTDLLLESQACRANPHSELCICADVRVHGLFPKEFEPDGTPKDEDGDGYAPSRSIDGVWEDHPDEADNHNSSLVGDEDNDKKRSDLEFMASDRYSQHCALSYVRENQRRLWYFAVALGTMFTVISMIWVGVTYMQNSASGVDLSRSRAMLMRVVIGIVILASAFLIWEGLNEVLFNRLDSWTLERGVFYDLP